MDTSGITYLRRRILSDLTLHASLVRREHFHMVLLLVLIVLWELSPPLPLKSAQLAVLVHMLLRLDQRAAWSVHSDNRHYHLELHAGSVLLALSLLELGRNVIIAMLGHTQIP